MKGNCFNCGYYHPSSEQCFRNAPITVEIDPKLPIESRTRTVWPKTNPSHWCGDWEAKEKKKKPTEREKFMEALCPPSNPFPCIYKTKPGTITWYDNVAEYKEAIGAE